MTNKKEEYFSQCGSRFHLQNITFHSMCYLPFPCNCSWNLQAISDKKLFLHQLDFLCNFNCMYIVQNICFMFQRSENKTHRLRKTLTTNDYFIFNFCKLHLDTCVIHIFGISSIWKNSYDHQDHRVFYLKYFKMYFIPVMQRWIWSHVA